MDGSLAFQSASVILYPQQFLITCPYSNGSSFQIQIYTANPEAVLGTTFLRQRCETCSSEKMLVDIHPWGARTPHHCLKECRYLNLSVQLSFHEDRKINDGGRI